MTGNEIRQKFIDFFKTRNHTLIRSSSLVPSNDPTLLFTNAGMVQFKRIFLGEENKRYTKATSSQKCLRAGGKHNDLKNVGYTARHHTFFEMLGNFSFGDYFKEEAIELAWDLIVNTYKMPNDKIWASVHNNDDEAYNLWRKNIGIPENRIVRLGDKENFWSMGETGPCGPCTELHIDRGKEFGCKKKDCSVNCNCDRFVELWNIVFMQFKRNTSGKITPLLKPSIDTGLGLERLSSIIQNVRSTFETDLIFPIINSIETLSEIEYGRSKHHDIAMKVIADHSRAIAFLIGDGVLPSNEGRGYVLRHIIRRAIRYGRSLNINKPFLHNTANVVFNIMEEAYPNLKESASYINNVTNREEVQFSETIEKGLKILNENIEKTIASGTNKIPGDLIFKLHDTYGFPIGIVRDLTKSKGLLLDLDGFDKNMNNQRKQSHSKKKFTNTCDAHTKLSANKIKPHFTGYHSLQTEARVVLLLLEGGIEVKSAKKGSNIEIVTDLTPLYGESGGQVGDCGTMESNNLKILIKNTLKNPLGHIIHKGKIIDGSITVGQKVLIKVNKISRINVSRNHTTTHILHSVLRNEFGENVKQSGSLVSDKKLRFDFTYFSKISRKELNKIEKKVNEQILYNNPIIVQTMTIDQAMKSGAIALFEEKYEDKVRIVSIGTFSNELCGGTHVNRTGDIGIFKILSEYGVSSGIRRIEALTGQYALVYTQKLYEMIHNTTLELKTSSSNMLKKIIDIKENNKLLKIKTEKLITENALLKMKPSKISNNLSRNIIVNGIKVRIEKVEVDTIKSLRTMNDQLKNEIKSGVVALGCEQKGKALLIVGITKDLTNKLNASKMIKEMAKFIGGQGGGRADMAQAGGTKPENLDQALKEIIIMIRNI